MILFSNNEAETEKIYFPKLGDFAGKYILPKEKVVVSNGKKYLELPILYRHDTTKVLYDLLDETIDFCSELYLSWNDEYGQYKSEFKKAFVSAKPDNEFYGLFDFEKVCNIIR